MMSPNGTGNVTIAITKLYLGDTDPDGSPDASNGWTYYGYNVDGVPPNALTKFCKPVNNASPASVHKEGMNGIENAFGHLVLPILLSLASDVSSKTNAAIAAGDFTDMVSMGQLGTGATYNPVLTQLFVGTNLGHTPAFDGTDMWPVSSAFLNDGATIASGSKIQFPTSYLTANTWVSGSPGVLTLPLGTFGLTFDTSLCSGPTLAQTPARNSRGNERHTVRRP